MTTAALPKKVAFRAEHTGSAAGDRAQRMAQQASLAHEQTKNVVAMLMNRVFVPLTTDQTIGGPSNPATLLTANLTTVLDAGSLIITMTTCGTHLTNTGTTVFRIVVDGAVAKFSATTAVAGYATCQGIVTRVPVTKGNHVVQLQWSTDINSARVLAASSNYEHASLLVQEST